MFITMMNIVMGLRFVITPTLMHNYTRKRGIHMRIFWKVFSVIMTIALLLTCCACDNVNSNCQEEALLTPTAQSLNEILTKEEQEKYSNYIDVTELKSQVFLGANVYYRLNVEGFDKLFEVGIKGAPILILKTVENEKVEGRSEPERASGFELSWFQMYAFTAICRVYHDDFLDSNEFVIKPSKNYYVYWKHVKEELEKLSASNTAYEEKIKQYVEFGIFAVPYVMEEIDKGKTEYESFFALIGAHLSTAEYMKSIGLESEDVQLPQEKKEEALLKSAEKFDYKDWIAQNEEDIDNLFSFLDEYEKEYEQKLKE